MAYQAFSAALGQIMQGRAARQASEYNYDVMMNEQKVARDQGLQAEGIQRNMGREALGRQSAAFAGAGVGSTGSSAVALRQSAVNTELDALNARYRGTITGYGYGAQGAVDRMRGQSAEANSRLLAGAALLRGMSSTYSTAPDATGSYTGGGTDTLAPSAGGFGDGSG